MNATSTASRGRLGVIAALGVALALTIGGLSMGSLSAQDTVDTGDVANNDAEVLAATLWITRHASELAAVASTTSHLGMTRDSLAEAAREAAVHRAGLYRQLDSLAGKGYDEQVGRIRVQADRLVANTSQITAGRPRVLAALGQNAETVAELISLARVMAVAGNESADEHFYDLTSDEIRWSLRNDMFRYAHMEGLAADIGAAGTFLVTSLLGADPSYIGLTEESYVAASDRLQSNLEFLTANHGRVLDPRIVPGARRILETGQREFSGVLEQRLNLVAGERDLIEENDAILHRLLFEVDSLAAAVLGTPAPTGSMPPEEAVGVPGVTDTAIHFGQSAALSGPSAVLGQGMELGIRAAFAEANRGGGVHGRSLTLLPTQDDGYDAQRAFVNTQRLLESGNVFGLIGAVGTPTSKTSAPLARADGAPFIAPFTGARFLREAPELSNAINFRASYHQETEQMVERLTKDLNVRRVAVLYQNDTYGVDGLEGVRQALDRRGLEPVAAEFYRRNTTAIRRASFHISEARPEAVIIIGAHKPAAAAIELLRDRLEQDPVFMAVSFVGTEALAAELGRLGESGAGVYVTQVTPLPDDTTRQVVREYQAALSAFNPDADPGFISLEGYLAGRVAIEGLRACPDLTRECFVDVFQQAGTVRIGDITLSYGPADNQGSDEVILTRLEEDGSYRPTSRLTRP